MSFTSFTTIIRKSPTPIHQPKSSSAHPSPIAFLEARHEHLPTPMFVPGSAELFNMEELPDRSNPRITNHPDVAAFFERMTYIPLAGITQMVPPGGGGIGMHVIPVEKAISMENEAIDIEKLSYWLDKYEGKIVFFWSPFCSIW